ncbi:MAG TPA: ATP-binding cassette domain-containing protein [Acidimicrobiales bacterium]|nr:ATP-binding cassette domain-containing protein [Acidimicrobiales bacterium]
MQPVIDARAVTKRYGKVEALSGLDLVIESGTIAAVLGPNGAGKTTLVRIVATLLSFDSGTVHVAGHDVTHQPHAVRRLIGLAGQSAAVEPAMTGRENLRMVGRLYGLTASEARRRADAVLERLSLADAGDRPVKTYSGGMRRRLDLGASLVGAPRLLLLDEPTTGLDPGSRIELWDTIRDLAASGTDVLLTTQYLDEADRLAAHVAIVDRGRVIAEGTPGELKARAGADRVEVHLRDEDDLVSAAAALTRVSGHEPAVDRGARRCSVSVERGTVVLGELARALDDAGVVVQDLTLRRPTLDEVFLSMTGRPAPELALASPRPAR